MDEKTRYGQNFAPTLLEWHNEHRRDLPWNKTKDPYIIWISEIILQQTQVSQGMPYFLRFVETFSTVYDLAKAKEEEVLKLWQGLGYYSRARNLHRAAQEVVLNYDGVMPTSKEELLTLAGIGEYTASAISSFAHGHDYVAIDGNVIRVITRVFGIDEAIDLARVKKLISARAHQELPKGKSANFNRALMDFGSKVCTPKSPDCGFCPFQEKCFAYINQRVDSIPAKRKKTKKRNRYFHFLWLSNGSNKHLFEKRVEKDIWQGLYQMPLIEASNNKGVSKEEILNYLENRELHGEGITIEKRGEVTKHILSHQNIFYQVHHVLGEFNMKEKEGWMTREEAQYKAFPKPLEKTLHAWLNQEK